MVSAPRTADRRRLPVVRAAAGLETAGMNLRFTTRRSDSPWVDVVWTCTSEQVSEMTSVAGARCGLVFWEYDGRRYAGVGVQPAHGLKTHVAKAGVRGHELCHHQVRPSPSHGHPQGVHDAGQRRRHQHPRDHLALSCPKRVGGVEHLVGHAGGDVRNKDDLLKEGSDEDNRDLLLEPDADPQDEQGDHRRHRQISGEVHDRLECRLDDAETAHHVICARMG
jgi:hypothetical protein